MSQEPLKVLYAGTPDTAVPPLEALHEDPRLQVVAVLTREDAPVGRKKTMTPSAVARRAEELDLPVLKANRVGPELHDALRATGASIAAVVAYGALLPQAALDVFEHGWINLHFSLLPQWRGAAPVQRALMAGDRVVGASTFVLDQGMDTGPVVGTLTDEVSEEDTAGTVLDRLAHTGAPLLAESLLGWPRVPCTRDLSVVRPVRRPSSPARTPGSRGHTLPWWWRTTSAASPRSPGRGRSSTASASRSNAWCRHPRSRGSPRVTWRFGTGRSSPGPGPTRWN